MEAHSRRQRVVISMDMDQLEGAFYDYMHQLGQVGPEWNRDVLSFYIPMFAGRHRVLDIGCGEGQFIQLLQDQGVEIVGIDSDTRMVEVCRRKGLEVIQADLFDFLPQHEGQFDGVFSSNLIEHLSTQEAVRFMQAAYQVLSPGGLLLVATPNPASLIVHLYEFWRDATHVRLYSRSLLEFLFHWAGLEQIESGENSATSWATSDEMQRVPQLLKEISAAKDPAARNQTRTQTLEPAGDGSISPLRRMALSLRRTLGRLVVRWVLFEEFAALNRQFGRIQQIEQATYHSQDMLLSQPREVFAIGVRPLSVQKD